jgi:hypothetical protein
LTPIELIDASVYAPPAVVDQVAYGGVLDGVLYPVTAG